MADLSDLQAAQTVKIAGSDNTGTETNYMDVDSSGRPTVKSQLYTAAGTAINFGQAVMASSLPVVIASNQSAIPVSNFPTTVDTNYGAVGASTIRAASQIGNATGAALFGAGTTTAQVLRVVLPTDQTAIPATQSGTWTVQPGNTANSTPWLVTDSSDGSVAAGTAAAKSSLSGLVFNTALPTLTNGQQAAMQGDSSGRLIIAPLLNTSVVKAQLQDNSGNGIASNNSQLQVRDVLNTAGQQRAQSVTTTAAEALGAATILANRKMISLTPTNGTIYWGFTAGVTVANGTPIFKNQTVAIAATDNLHIYVISAGTVDTRIAEAS